MSARLKAYLDDFEKNPKGFFANRKDVKFKEKKHAIDPTQLALVAFVQDDATKEVLQAAYLRLGSGAHTGN
jgi:hypothetical protein